MSKSTPIRLLLVDDHPMMRRGLATVIKVYDDIELVGEAANGEDAFELCEQLRPDVVLMDILMPGAGGLEATRIIHLSFPGVRVVVLTGSGTTDLIKQALQLGAVGFLLKDVSADELIQAIRSAHSGQVTLSPTSALALASSSTQPHELGYGLTSREQEVLALMIDGLSNSEIAGKLGVSPSTIKSHVSNILSKLHASGRTEAVAMAMRSKITS